MRFNLNKKSFSNNAPYAASAPRKKKTIICVTNSRDINTVTEAKVVLIDFLFI